MDYTIEYFDEEVQERILELPDTLAARYVVLTRLITAIGPNLGPPHTDAFGDGLFELRLIKKTQKTPPKEIELARKRMKEVKNANP